MQIQVGICMDSTLFLIFFLSRKNFILSLKVHVRLHLDCTMVAVLTGTATSATSPGLHCYTTAQELAEYENNASLFIYQFIIFLETFFES